MKAKSQLPLGPAAGPINVAVQRPTVNIKEAENAGEQAVAAARHAGDSKPGLRFSKHGTFGSPAGLHPLEKMWEQ